MKDPRKLGDPGTPAFQLERYPFYLLNRLVSRYNVVIETRLKTIGIDIPYWRVLMVLGQKSPRSVGQLSEAAVIPFSTMTRIVQRMVTAKLVTCRQLETDNRVIEVKMTAKGKRTLADARMITAPVYAQIIQNFSVEEFEQLTLGLDRLYDNLETLVPANGRKPRA